jgi:transposase InsO family protein
VDEETVRRLAISWFEQGEPPSEIWPRLGRSRRWFFKWLARYRAGGPAALQSRSRAHRTHPRMTTPAVRSKVLELREAHSGWGERTIARELPAHLIGPRPAPATVGRILRAAGATRRTRARTVPDARYPRVVPQQALELVEHDFIGPRWIVGFGRVFGYQSIDVFSRSVCLGAEGDKAASTQLAYWLSLFQRFGLPEVVQTDNEFGLTSTAMRGTFTRVTRLFLALGIEHRFIPAGEPYRNGHIERFNRTYRYDFYDQHVFRDLAHLRAREAQYERYFNEARPHGGIGYAVPASRFPLERPHLAAELGLGDFDLDYRRLAAGRVSYVRRVDAEGEIEILNHQVVRLDPSLAGQYVTAVVRTPSIDLDVLTVDGELVPAIRTGGAR